MSRHTALSRLGPAVLTAMVIAFCVIVVDSGRVAARGQAPAPQAQQGGYVGQDTCLTCHDTANLHGTAHGNAKIPGSPAADKACESCHGPGQAHVDDDAKGHILKFTTVPAREANEACMTCHNKTQHAMWDSSAHAARNLACVSCHSVHAPKSEHAQLRKANEIELCATCHKLQAQKQLRTSHMPVREGKMTCSSCHNVHGSVNVKLLRVGTTVDQSCTSCHTEKRGPFLWEHAPVVDSCTTCHDSHGSNNDRMLVAKLPFLCQRCHVTSRHPPTVYEGFTLQNSSNANKMFGKACANCASR